MKHIDRKSIDWVKTGRCLQLLREDDRNLRRRVCYALNIDKNECSGECKACRFEIDNHISRQELAAVFGVSESVIFNWENGRSEVRFEDLLFYAQLAGTSVEELVVFNE